ncbi:type II toxin-antitoxin system PemK/MazF family toxin [Gordonia sp. TBRC 11910]|uniref:Type II toxin-antitoxin system PemK/MazF family toxin n=1 Tax=Gordonia asplenii TaxID=2725283 RepID=A0A848KQL8_9ACTN|nr:type II toxin-antitoxin system PemK/MazF family toxin [Gordonia asplenii]NMO01294.1 type II toxin-antitoxin system PemK/MazF family toxin [Gordonia asplenii]
MPAHPANRNSYPQTAPTADFARVISYAPDLDGAADPGEVVWTWVPFEDDPTQGKDRPVLVVGRGTDDLLGLMLSSKDYHRSDADWFALGPGVWDREGRDSYVRLDRVLIVAEHGIRREGAILERRRFDQIARELCERYGWSV